jgi:uroporphyrinogen-III synthase
VTPVLVTRPEPGATATATLLLAMGFQPIVAPLLTIHPLAVTLPAPGDVQAILVASRQAVPPLPAEFLAVPLLAVGDATAEAARAHGFQTVSSAEGDATALARLARRLCKPSGGPLLLATGLGQGFRLEGLLADAGFTVLRREVYTAHPVPALPPSAQEMLTTAQAGWVLLFSGETASCLSRLVRATDRLAGIRPLSLAALSPSVAEAARDLPWRSIHVAMTPTENAVLALIHER